MENYIEIALDELKTGIVTGFVMIGILTVGYFIGETIREFFTWIKERVL